MSTDPSAPPPPAARAFPVGDFVADLVAASRPQFGIVLVILGVLGLLAAGYCGTKVFRSPKAEKSDKPAEGQAEVALADPNRGEFILGGIGGLMAAAAGLGVGATLLVGVPKPTQEARRTDARTAVLLAGGMFGATLMVLGLAFLVLWFGSVGKWLDAGDRSEMRWVVGPLLAVVAGAGLAFLAAQPARAEERNNAFLRRLVYGANSALGVLLLVVLLVVGNVFVALRVPNRLDTTASGFYTLSDETKDLIAGLDQPVTAYSTLTQSEEEDPRVERPVRDARSLLAACQEVNPAKFKVRFLSPALDAQEIARLQNKYPQFDKNDLGILLATGDDESRASFLRLDDLFTQEFEGRTPQMVFQGEGRLVRELLFLSEGKTRAAVYFTQKNGELEVTAAPAEGERTTGGRSASQIRTLLEKNYVDVKPLDFDPAAPKVPDDAAVVVVADPRTPLPKEQADAIGRYMSEPRPGGKKGKLIVLAGPHPRPDRTGVADTGLEGVLGGLGVELGRGYLLRGPALEGVGLTEVVAAPGKTAFDDRNPIVLAFQALILPDCREVLAARTPPGGPVKTDALFLSNPDAGYTWVEPDPQENPVKRFSELQKSAELRAKLRLSRSPRAVAVAVSEPPESPGKGSAVGRAVVFGTGQFFADPAGRRPRGGQQGAEVLAASLDYLRDRPAAANIATKTYGRYTPKPDPDDFRILVLPVLGTLLVVLALGVGVWVFRMK